MTVREWAGTTYINGIMELYFYQHGEEIESVMFIDGYILPQITKHTALKEIHHIDVETKNRAIDVQVYLKG